MMNMKFEGLQNLINKEYDNDIPLCSESDTPITRLRGAENGVFWMLAPNIPVMSHKPGAVWVAIDLSTTGITMAYKMGAGLPEPVNRSDQFTLLTPVSDTDYSATMASCLGNDQEASGYSTPTVARMNTEVSETNTEHSMAAQTFTVFDRTIISEIMVQSNGGEDPFSKNGIISAPKQVLGSASENSGAYQKNYRAFVGLSIDAMIRAVRAFPDKRRDDFQFILTYASTNDSFSRRALNDAITGVNEILGEGYLEEGQNVTIIPEYLAARNYYLNYNLPDGTAPGKHFCTVDIGSFSTDLSLTLGGKIVKSFSLPFAGHSITVDTWKQICVYDPMQAKKLFLTNNNAYAGMLLNDSLRMVNEMMKLADDPDLAINRVDIAESRMLDAYFDLLSKFINEKKIDARLFTLLSRTKLSGLLWILEREIHNSLATVTIQPGETLNIVFLGRGSYAFRNLSKAGSELLKAWEDHIRETFSISVKVMLADSTQKIQLVNGCLSFPADAGNRPIIPQVNMAAVDNDRFAYYANMHGTEEAAGLYANMKNVKAGNFGAANEARKKLSSLMYEKIHQEYTYEDYKRDLSEAYLEEVGRADANSYLSRNHRAEYVADKLSDRNLFNEAKTIMGEETFEDIQRFTLSATGAEKELYFLKMLELVIKRATTGGKKDGYYL